MKKVFGMMALALALAACNKKEIDFQPADNAEGIPFSATVSTGKSLDTRALAESGTTLQIKWIVGEKVALIHNGVSDEMTVSFSSAGTATITGTITGNPSDGDPVTIIYPSSAADGTSGNVKSNLLDAQDGTLTGTGGTSIAEKCDVRKGTGTLKVSETASLDGNVSLHNQFAIFKFTVRAADGTTAINAKRLSVTIGSNTYTITPTTATDVLYAALPEVSARKVSFETTDDFGRVYNCAKQSVTFAAANYYQSTLKMKITEHEYVDMGYGMKWSTMYIGASGSHTTGDYFAWGEIAPKSTYSLDNYFDPDYQIYRYQSGPTMGRPIKLKREDDAASFLWGDDWRMPNFEEITMLADKNKFTWTWKDEERGYLVTSKQTGKSIFLRITGAISGSEVGGDTTWGGFWASSTKTTGSDMGAILYYADHDSRAGVVNSRYRYFGFPIRPIRVNKVNGHEYIDLGNGLGWAVENLGTDDSHPTGRADTFANGDPATAKWGAPWRTATKAEWEWVLNTDNCKREKSADYETAGLWFVSRESMKLGSSSIMPDRAIFLPNTNEGYFLYWTSTRNDSGKLKYISVTDSYIKYITSEDTKYQFSRPVFSLSELDK